MTLLQIKKLQVLKKFELLTKVYWFLFNKFRLKKQLNQKFQKKNMWKKLLIKQQCFISAQGRSSYKICGLSRFRIKEYISIGFIPSLMKISW